MRNKIRIQLIPQTNINQHGAHCNFNCIWCHNDFFAFQTDRYRYDVSDQISAIMEGISTIEPYYEQKLPVQISAAGEPTMIGLANLENLIRKLCQIGYHDIGLTTNGSKMVPKFIYRLKEAGLTSINFSVNSINPVTYAAITGSSVKTLSKVLQHIDFSLHAGLETSVNCIYSSFNQFEFREILQYLAQKNNLTWKFFDLIGNSPYYQPIQSLIQDLEDLDFQFTKMADSEYIHLITNVGRSRIKIKISREENSCPNVICKLRSECTEGCRASIRISAMGIQPCGIKRENMIHRHQYDDFSFVKEQLMEGGKLERIYSTFEIL